jgi:PAS domain-containing protein
MGILLLATPLRAYGLSLLLTLLASLLTLAAWPLLYKIPLILFLATVALSAWYGGLGPGLFATALALIVSALFIMPPGVGVTEQSLADLGRLGLFSVVGALLSALQAQRQQAEERLRRVIEYAPSAMVMVNGQGQIVLVNRQTEQLFGYLRAQLLGQPVELLVPARLRLQHPSFRTTFLATPQARPM